MINFQIINPPMFNLLSPSAYSRRKNLGKSLNLGKFLAGFLLFSLLSINPVQGCAYPDQDLSSNSPVPSTSQSQTSSPLISQSPMVPQVIADKILADLAQRTGQPITAFKIESSENENWPDSCLGLAQEGQMCAQVITPGWKITVRSDAKSWVYRTNQNGRLVLLEL